MKDLVITACRKKTELITLLVCFVLANLLNLYSIIAYGTPWTELITSMGYVLVLTALLYVVWTLLRVLFFGIKTVFVRSKSS